ncbi:tyrosine-type recombinase/integrase [Holdemania massiliensis]|uniref:tyrosine-type recombinase/integrase n=1 Tax=Holdemania massiliensis TaxID=1468449 RepID=UPI001F0681DE|nr:tyrosine-type recombinase/integrase [Holdemania massiliensis]MCH1941645.1 tyrosine-type recombinase/integrase [Holdemania massiliensis]
MLVIVRKYNKSHEIPLLKITPHTLRHTFCTRFVQKKMGPKNQRYILGHAIITISLVLYAHASENGANVKMLSMIA